MQRVNDDVQVRVIVADDCSTDKTLEIIKSYEKKSPFVFVYLPEEQNMGHVRNYQRAFAACDGDYICVLEGDDYWLDYLRVQKHIDFLNNHNECALSVNGIVLYWQEVDKYEKHEEESHQEISYVDLKEQILVNNIGNHSSACYRTKLIKTMPDKFYSKTFDDALIGIWCAQFGYIAKLCEYTTVYRKHGKGLWAGMSKSMQDKEIVRRLKRNDKLFSYKYHFVFADAISLYSPAPKIGAYIKFLKKIVKKFLKNIN